MFIKPVLDSKLVGNKLKLLFENIIVVVVSLLASSTLLFGLLAISNSNMFFSTFMSSLCFSLISYSGFEDIYLENAILKNFKTKTTPIIRPF